MRRTGHVLSAVALGAVACSEPSQPEVVIRPVRSEVVYATGTQRTRSFTGVARASTESRLSFKVAGTVERLAVSVGERVPAGGLIASLDPTDYELQVQQAKQSLLQAQAEERNASANLDRLRQLYENNNVSRTELDAADAAAASTQASVGLGETALRQARRQLGYCQLKAPIEGAIASTDVEVNENVRAGQQVVLLTSGTRAEVMLSVPEVLIGQIHEGRPAEVRFDAIREQSFAATVTEVGVTSTGMETTFPVRVRLDQDSSDVRPGMAAEVTIVTAAGGGDDVILVPFVAVGEDRNGERFVFCVHPAGDGLARVERRAVVIGSHVGNSLEVVSGLEDGDRVVTAGVSRIQDGMTVKGLEANGS